MGNDLNKIINELQDINKKLEISENYSRQLINSLGDGVFFLDSKMNFLDNFSDSCKEILGVENLHKRNFIKFLSNKIPEKTINETQEYLDLMFSEEHQEETINELNPLNEIEFHIPSENGMWSATKYLTFTFKRFQCEPEKKCLLSIVKDVTLNIELSKKLKYTENQSKKKIEWLLNLLHVEPPLLKEFVSLFDFELKTIDKVLKSAGKESDYGLILKKVTRSIHHINSNASILNLGFITKETRVLKEEVDNYKSKDISAGQDFIPLIVKIGGVQQLLNEIKELLPHIKGIDDSLRTTRRFDGGLLTRALENLIKNLTEESGKKIIIKYHNFDSMAIPHKYNQLVKEFLIVLTRFVIEFGIEEPEKRKSINVNPTAIIEIETIPQDKSLNIKFRHDGNLVRIERMLEQKVEEESVHPVDTKSEEGSLHPGFEVMRMFFTPDISTSTSVGTSESMQIVNDLQVVKNKLRMHGGQLKVIFASGSFCEYNIILPIRIRHK